MSKHVDRGFERLENARYEEADREFRLAECCGGRSLVAFKSRRFERAMNQACKCLDGGEDHFPREREAALKVIKLSLERVNPDEMNRPGIVLPKARDQVGDVSWGEVNASVAEFVENKPLFSDLLEDESAGEGLKHEKIEEAFNLIREGRLDEGFNLFADLHDGYRDDPFLSVCWAVSPDYVEDAPSELGLSKFRDEVEQAFRLSEDASDPVRASILGFCLFNLYLEWGDKENVLEEGRRTLERSLECFERAEELEEGDDFNRCYRGLCYGLKGELGRAISILDGVSEDSSWYSVSRASVEEFQEVLEKRHAAEKIQNLILRAEEARRGGREKDELQFLEELSSEYFDGDGHGIEKLVEQEIGYGAIYERIIELKLNLNIEPELEALKSAAEHNPDNERVIGHLVEKGVKKLDDGDFEGAIKYFETVPADHGNPQFLKSYGKALKKSRKYGRAAEVFEELSSTDPDFFLPLAECNLHLGEREDVLGNLKDLFKRTDSVPDLEEGLKMAADRQVGTDEEIISLCERLLAKSDNNEVALSTKRKAERRLEEKKRRKLSGLEDEGMESYRAENYGEALKLFSDVPEDFLSPDSVRAVAESQETLGRHEKALEWYEKLPETVENISSKANCALEMGGYEEASDRCEDLLKMIERPEEAPHPNVQGLILEKQNRFQEAASRYEDEELVLRLSESLMESGRVEEGILVLEKLWNRFRKKEHYEKLEEAVMDREGELSVGFKAGLKISEGRKEIVVCDTNILIYKAFDEIGLSPSRRLRRTASAIKKFGQLASQGNRVLVPEAAERELKPVCERKLEEEEDLGEEEKDRVRERVERYIEKYDLGDLPVDAPVGIEEEYLKRARNFYRNYPEKLRKITERKIGEAPERKHEILLKRGEKYSSKGTTPGEGDVRLLAECIRLSELSVPGIWQVSLLSNDSDFLWFSSDIERELGIKIHNI